MANCTLNSRLALGPIAAGSLSALALVYNVRAAVSESSAYANGRLVGIPVTEQSGIKLFESDFSLTRTVGDRTIDLLSAMECVVGSGKVRANKELAKSLGSVLEIIRYVNKDGTISAARLKEGATEEQAKIDAFNIALSLEAALMLTVEDPTLWGQVMPSAAFEVFPKEAGNASANEQLAAAEGRVAQLEKDLAAAKAGRPAPEAPSWTTPQSGNGEGLNLPIAGLAAVLGIAAIYGLRKAGMGAEPAVNKVVKRLMQADPKKLKDDSAAALWRMREGDASAPLPDNFRASLQGPITKKEALTLRLQYLRKQYTVAESGRAIAFQIDIVNDRLAAIAKAEAKAARKDVAARAKSGRSWFSGWHLPRLRLPHLSFRRKPVAPEVRTEPGPVVEIRDTAGQLTQVRVWRRPHSSRVTVWTLSDPMTAAEIEGRLRLNDHDRQYPSAPETVDGRLINLRKNLANPSLSHNVEAIQRELAAEVLELAHLEAALALFTAPT